MKRADGSETAAGPQPARVLTFRMVKARHARPCVRRRVDKLTRNCVLETDLEVCCWTETVFPVSGKETF